eukprot:CAMPEP_0168200316 /NCGR_PEP_ID=MMETSP0139_2-20121125/22977_1 /TAXON_ID=44445 /ORGANISM="Pseudo-nitzschia australis, Strain 10249 10 AB" /LENGTH=304 /DNA_ID=CAMNT_0008125535 /DNA_START=318 /DNA_END=1229 /DNA_ORIENTATION=+
MPIDYSKWDRLEVSSSDEEDDGDDSNNNNHATTTPRVTRLEAPSKVTFGGGFSSITASPSAPNTSTRSSAFANTKQAKNPEEDCVSPHKRDDDAIVPATTRDGDGKERGAPPAWTERGGLVVVAANDQQQEEHQHRNLYWAQDRYSVTLRLEVKEDEKVRSVDVRGILPYSDRFAAVGSTKPKLSIRRRGVRVNGSDNDDDNNKSSTKGTLPLLLLEGELPHPVHFAEGDDDENLVDWSVEEATWKKNHFTKHLTITLHKAVPMQGLSLWWRRPLTDFPEVDLDHVKVGNPSSNGASNDFRQAW